MRFTDYFEKCMANDRGLAAFIDGDVTYSWSEVEILSRRIACRLAGDFPQGGNIAVYSPNDTIAFVCVLGALRAGCTWVPLNWRNSVEANAHLIRQTGCSVLFTHSTFLEQAREIAGGSRSGCRLICLDGGGDGVMDTLAAFMADETAQLAPLSVFRDQPMALFPTGGTTGFSKAARWSARTFEATMNAYWQCLPRGEPIVHLVAGPMTHAAGLLTLLMLPDAPTNVILKSPDPRTILESIEKHRVTHLYVPPTLLYMMLDEPRVAEFDYSSLRHLVLAAAPVAPEKLRQALDRFGPVVCQSFGQAEAPMFMTFLRTQDLLEDLDAGGRRLASCGRETMVVRLAIMDDTGELLGNRERGEIVVRGPLVFDGYHENEAATAEACRDGWHRTGDVGYRDDDGFVYIVDRKKDMVVTGGFNVYTAEVEQVVLSHPKVRDCVVIGVPDPKWGEAVKAVVELKDGEELPDREIIDLVRSKLGAVCAPKSVEAVQHLPRSPNGKVLKRVVRDAFWTDQDRRV